MTHLRCFNGLWIAPVVLATSLLAATTDVRLVEAVKNSDKAAVQTLLPQHIDLFIFEPQAGQFRDMHYRLAINHRHPLS